MLPANYFDIEHQYTALSPQHKLVILHPSAYSVHRLFCKHLLNDAQAVYIPMGYQSDPEQDAIDLIFQAINEQLEINIERPSDDIIELAQTLANGLNGAVGSRLYIDNFHHEDYPMLTELLLETVPRLKDGQRIILCGRVFPNIFVQELLEQENVAVIPTDSERLLIDYANPASTSDILEVHAFGQGTVLVNGQPITEWEGILPRALFFYFMDRGMATRDEIFKTFWPQLGKNEATNVFHVTKRKISEILGVHPTTYGSGFYRISPDIQLYYDVINFREAVQSAAIVDDEQAEKLFNIAIDLYQDDFLSTLDHEWVLKRRSEMRNSYTDALVGLARIHERRNHLPETLGFFQRALATTPLREDLVRSIMTIQAELGYLERAKEAYHHLAEQLAEEFKVKPDPLTTELLAKLTGE